MYIGFAPDGSPAPDNSPPWKEIVFASANPRIVEEEVRTVVSLNGKPIDSYTTQAMRRKIILPQEDLLPTRIDGFLVKGDSFILGVRGGSDCVGVLQPIPMGYVHWKESYSPDPFSATFAEETAEEAGTTLINPTLYGLFNQQAKHVTHVWFFKAEPADSLESIASQLGLGKLFYDLERGQHHDEKRARTALRATSFPPDSWENSETIILPYNGESLLRLLADKGWTTARRTFETFESLPVDAYIAGVVDFGEDFKKEAKPYLEKVV